MQVTQDGARSATAAARRAQIIEAAIETIATEGYARASFARIAKRAGVSSTRLISYHFDGKDDLIEEVVKQVYAAGAAYMTPRIAEQTTHTGRLRAYIEANLRFMSENPRHILAVTDIIYARRGEKNTAGQDAAADRAAAPLRQLLENGQAAGEFRPFTARNLAWIIRAAIDDAGFRFAGDPALDLDTYAAELTTFVDLATRAGP